MLGLPIRHEFSGRRCKESLQSRLCGGEFSGVFFKKGLTILAN